MKNVVASRFVNLQMFFYFTRLINRLSFAQSTISVTYDCPFEATGKYKFNGKMFFFDVNHSGDYVVKSGTAKNATKFNTLYIYNTKHKSSNIQILNNM